MTKEPTDTEAGKVYGTIHYTSLHQKLGDFARHFYKLGKEAKIGDFADLNHKLNSEMIRIAELERQNARLQKLNDHLAKEVSGLLARLDTMKKRRR